MPELSLSSPPLQRQVHWGMLLESCWCLWTGFELAPRGQDPAMATMEDEALSVSANDPRQRREVEAYNMAVRRGS